MTAFPAAGRVLDRREAEVTREHELERIGDIGEQVAHLVTGGLRELTGHPASSRSLI